MSHSTHVGFSCPPGLATSFKFGECHSPLCFIRARREDGLSPVRQSRAAGVGHNVTASVNVLPLWIPVGGMLCLLAVELRADLLSPTVGVGQRFLRAIVSSEGRTLPTLPAPPPRFVPQGPATGVGNDEYPITSVRGTNCESRYAVPFRIIPARGQVSEYVSKEPSIVC